jgi:hypothetical protein
MQTAPVSMCGGLGGRKRSEHQLLVQSIPSLWFLRCRYVF